MDQTEELRRNGLGALAVLPDHLISYITFLLDLEDVVRLSCCSRILRVFACEEPLWLGLCLKVYEGLVEFKANWRHTALAGYTARHVPPEALEAAARPLPPLAGLSSLFLYKRWYRGHVDLRAFLPPPGAPSVERVDAVGMTAVQFAERYDRTSMPVLMSGLVDKWPVASWSLPALSAAFPAARFKVAKPHGGRALMTLPAYVDYMARQTDEEPLYIFDATFAEAAPGIRQLYDVPHVFDQDYFSLLGAGRPHYRWLVLGPARAGASWHVDPSLTSAWNALLSGRKRWAVYPPHEVPPGITFDEDDDDEELHPSDDNLTSLQWFLEVYPTLPPEKRPIEFVQNPGEVVFVPGGWWHCVLNLETAVAVTQNYVNDANLDRVVRYLSHGSVHYHAAPLEYYDPQTEVAIWTAAYPYLAPKSESESGSESDTESSSEEEQEGCGLKKNRKGAGEGVEVDGEPEGVAKAGMVRPLELRRIPSEAAEAGVHGAAANGDQVACTGGVVDGPGVLVPARVPSVPWRSELEYEEAAVWRRHRPLGRWLRRLWEQEPRTRPAIQGVLTRYLHGATWRNVLRTIAAQLGGPALPGGPAGWNQAGAAAAAEAAAETAAAVAAGDVQRPRLLPAEPTPLELIPVTGADALVFMYGGVAIKIFLHEVPAMRALMCAFESYLPPLMRAAVTGATQAAACPDQPTITASTSPTGLPGPPSAAASTLPAYQLPQPLASGSVALALTQREPWRDEPDASTTADLPRAPRPGTASVNGGIASEPGGGGGGGGDGGDGGAGTKRPKRLRSRVSEASPGQDLPPSRRSAHRQRHQQRRRRSASAVSAAAAVEPGGGAWKPGGPSSEGGGGGAMGPDRTRGKGAGPGAASGEQLVLYLVQEQLQGKLELVDMLEAKPSPARLAAVAEALGHLVGAMHATAARTAADTAAHAMASNGKAAAAAPAGECRGGAEGNGAGLAPMDISTGADDADALPPPLHYVEGWGRLVRSAAVWHNRTGYIWVSGAGCVSTAPPDSDDSGDEDELCQHPVDVAAPAASPPPSGTADDGSKPAATAAALAVGPPWPCHVPQDSPWWPFVQHLRRRQRAVLRGLSSPEPVWPGWVVQQLPAFLPVDPAQLLGFPLLHSPQAEGKEGEPQVAGETQGLQSMARAEAAPQVTVLGGGVDCSREPSAPPLLLHGDLTSRNVVLAELPPGAGGDADDGNGAWRPALSLVDFADAGHGDPLYELLPVLGSCMACDAGAMARFWASYCRHVDLDRLWPGRPPGWKLSYCAMCHSLLHEEAEQMFNRALGPEAPDTTPAASAGAAESGSGGEDGIGSARARPTGGEAQAAGQSGRTLERLAAMLWGFLDGA